ncbi:MAG: MBL fold metallo-hydrolase [Burkholderiaceae bacterium]|nr:Beta-lactamase hydrolase-like protein [Pseudorhodoplanes sp.]MBW7924485.1 MBL fold metallo-hydrolase [Burkholderiaceae bacterium]
MAQQPVVTGFYHEPTGSIAYLVEDPATQRGAIIDPVLDYDEKAGRITSEAADALVAAVRARGLSVDFILDTHPHADHLSAAAYLKDKLGAPTAIGAQVVAVQKLWQAIYNLPDFPADGSQWDRLFAHGDTFRIGALEARVMHSPGHTLASVTYVVGDAAFVHDTLFQPDTGSARCDFPGGSASVLYDSIMAILALPDDTRLYTGHDYKQDGRAPQWQSSVAEQKRANIHFRNRPTREDYVALREARDRTLPMPRLILHALQFNMRGGRLPEPEANGRSYFRIPIGAL